MNQGNEIVSVESLASEFGITSSRIHQLVELGLPKETRGRYDLRKCSRWYIRYLQKAVERKGVPTSQGGFASEREERTRLLRADADLKEIELARQRSQLVSIADVEALVTDLVLTTKVRILAIPPRLAPDLVGETSRVMIHAKLEKACKEALVYLSKAADNGPPEFPPSRKA
jgi:phage terminase Nu1 subunit (DNA packaging protein)